MKLVCFEFKTNNTDFFMEEWSLKGNISWLRYVDLFQINSAAGYLHQAVWISNTMKFRLKRTRKVSSVNRKNLYLWLSSYFRISHDWNKIITRRTLITWESRHFNRIGRTSLIWKWQDRNLIFKWKLLK